MRVRANLKKTPPRLRPRFDQHDASVKEFEQQLRDRKASLYPPMPILEKNDIEEKQAEYNKYIKHPMIIPTTAFAQIGVNRLSKILREHDEKY